MKPPIDLLPYALACQESYKRADFESVETDTQAIVYPHRDGPILAFRGTENVQDWKTNLDGGFTALRDGVLVREGFADAWISVFDEVKNWAARMRGRDPEFRLRITGHSLGGALATVAALDLAPHSDKITLVTFGAPRCMHRSTPLHNQINAYRVVNNNDIVPRVPPESAGYNHRGELLYFDESGAYHHHPGNWTQLRDRIEGRLADIGEPGTDGIKDHSITEYVRLAILNV